MGMQAQTNKGPAQGIKRCIAFLLLVFLNNSIYGQSTVQPSGQTQEPPIPVHFTDVRKAAGITFVQDSTQTDEKYYLETMGTGLGWIDYDQDGLLDLYFVQSGATD